MIQNFFPPRPIFTKFSFVNYQEVIRTILHRRLVLKQRKIFSNFYMFTSEFPIASMIFLVCNSFASSYPGVM